MNTLGVVGGLGPRPTSDFYTSVIERVAQYGQGQLPRMIVYSVPMPANIETALVRGESTIIHNYTQSLKMILGEATQLKAFFLLPTTSLSCTGGRKGKLSAPIKTPFNFAQEDIHPIAAKILSRLLRSNRVPFRPGCRKIVKQLLCRAHPP